MLKKQYSFHDMMFLLLAIFSTLEGKTQLCFDPFAAEPCSPARVYTLQVSLVYTSWHKEKVLNLYK
uniref:Uncharacterized protein n=1 Tax=Arundo donax TaxID=35708 RepID=A0A0A9G8A6_ARUDO